ncbi:uncharacterized protein LOC128326342 [Hemicordylus capensis]|uniref:uncharacterized protein LOC128326342 n=1 Tax=Hemicordylus capensis TaxID=884348 RepID=UPI002302BACD|nr:uncharacterized protein LOC128326342 [Hemicordylus capensis]XP_053108998.1 uncharacterized protein LOC128326342 [Hemicordylus capensis]XP_053108999.1 uncharacterized protein LOC128326342 [Hemicordylus capensis]
MVRRSLTKKKESGAEGRKRRKLEAEEAKKLSKFFMSFFEKPGTSSSSPSMELPAPATILLESESGASTNASPAEDEEVKSEKFEYDEIKSEAATENMDMTGGEGGGDIEFIDEILPDKTEPDVTEPSKLDGVKKPQTVILEVIEQHDIGLLKFDKDTGKAILPDTLRTEIIKLGSKYFQNSEGPFLPTNNRSMSKTWFKRKLGNGHGVEVTRSWLVYSPSKRSAFCICCLLYSQSGHQSSLEQESGFNHWKKPERISVHEKAENHRKCFIQWKEMERNLVKNRGIIDAVLQPQIAKEKQEWQDILTRILHCIKFLATQNLAVQGHRESLQLGNDDSNVGNFLGLLKLLAIFDPVMKEHLTHMESHPGSTSYLSPGVQNEFIHMMASTVRQSLLSSIRKAKYYGLMLDSTPDKAHSEQMSEVVRYVEIDCERKAVHVRESFLGFIQVNRKDAESLVEDILKQLEKDEMELQDCRSQCYDNAAVMAGHRSGVYQRISEKNNLAVFVSCDYRSLNLVGVHAAEQDTMMATFFGTIEALYVFFSHSTQRWEKLKNAVPVVVESESESRWSARAEAVKPVNKYLKEILQVLQDMIDNENETSETRSDARQLYNCMLSYDFLTLLGFWNKVLIRIDHIQKRLQDPSTNFHDAALELKALRDHFDDEREVLVSKSLEEGLGLCQEWNIAVERYQIQKKQMADENSRDAGLTAKEEMERVMKGTLDHLHREMDESFTHLHNTDAKFGFLLDIEGLCYGAKRNDLKKKCENFAELYSSDVDGGELYEEILDCRMLLSVRTNMKISRPEELLKFLIQYGDKSVFPNLCNAIQIMLTIVVSLASCERSYSKLKLILPYLRASMGQGGLCDLALLSVEREETEKTDFDHIVDQFASVKARKVQL